MKRKQTVVLWRYDLFPYVLCGILESRCTTAKYPGEGYVRVDGFDGMYFKPFAETNDVSLPDKLEQLRFKHRIATDALNRQFVEERNALLAQAGLTKRQIAAAGSTK